MHTIFSISSKFSLSITFSLISPCITFKNKPLLLKTRTNNKKKTKTKRKKEKIKNKTRQNQIFNHFSQKILRSKDKTKTGIPTLQLCKFIFPISLFTFEIEKTEKKSVLWTGIVVPGKPIRSHKFHQNRRVTDTVRPVVGSRSKKGLPT